MIGISWEAIGADSIPLQSLFSADDLAKMQAGKLAQKTTADRIMIWDPATDSYTAYYLRSNNQGIMGWANYNGDQVNTSATISKGSAMWFYRQAAQDITVNLTGQVADDATFSHSIKGTAGGNSGYNMIAAGFPRDIPLNTIQFAWATGTSGKLAQKTTADRIMVWDPSTDSYTAYYLRSNNQGIMGWANYNGDQVNANAVIPAGGAAWYFRQDTTDITVSEASPLN